jgi:hypothetical protein
MFKRLLVAIAVIIVGVFVWWQGNLSKTSYVNGVVPYDALLNRQFIFERDCYIFDMDSHHADWPLVGDHTVVPSLPADVNEKNIGASLPGVRILDVVRVGDRFKIFNIRRDQDKSGTHITFELLFLDEDARRYPRLDAFWIMDHAPESKGEAPGLLEAYAIRRAEK